MENWKSRFDEEWIIERLPDSWVVQQIDRFSDVVRGGSPRPMGDPRFFDGNIPFIKISDVTKSDGFIVKDSETKVNEEGAKRSRFLKKGTLILSNSGTVCVPVFLGADACIHDGFVTFEDLPDEILDLFLFHFFRFIKPAIVRKHRQGVTQVNLNTGLVGEIAVPLPPLNEQKRIVAKIEELFSELDAGVENLKKAKEQLGIYRQSLLKQAFEGKLTEQWRKDHADELESAETLLANIRAEREARYQQQLQDWQTAVSIWESNGGEGKKPPKPKRAKTVEPLLSKTKLQDGWVWLRIEDLLTKTPSNGRSVKDRIGGFRVLRLTALREGKIDLEEFKEGDWDQNTAEPFIIRKGDFLISRGNGSKKLVARGGVVPTDELIAYPDTMIRLPLDLNVVSADCFSLLWNSDVFRRQIEKTARTTAGIYKINQSIVCSYEFPICSLPEQREIVRILDEQFAAIEENEKEIEAALQRAEALRQSILKKAFSGELVPQDPNDEPASVLLERIRKEREAATLTKKPSPRRKKSASSK